MLMFSAYLLEFGQQLHAEKGGEPRTPAVASRPVKEERAGARTRSLTLTRTSLDQVDRLKKLLLQKFKIHQNRIISTSFLDMSD